MRADKGSLSAVIAVGYLIVSFAAPSAAAAMQEVVSVLYSARVESTAGGQLALPISELDTTDVLAGVGNSESMTISAFVSVAERGSMTGSAVVFSNTIEVTASVAGKRKPKVLARLQGQLSSNQLSMSKTIAAKKMINKGPVSFDVSTSSESLVAYDAEVTYKIARGSQ